MANPPPPYDNITGISRAVMKDNAQETLANYNGNARPGEIVADLTTDPPALYVGNNAGLLTAIATGGGGNAGLPLANGSSNFDIATINGNVTITAGGSNIWTFNTNSVLAVAGNIDFGGDSSAAPSLNDFFSVTSAVDFSIVTDSANTDQTWTFDNTGNLGLPGGGILYGNPYTPSGSPGNTITLQPAGSGIITDQKLLVYPTAADGDHIHLTSGNLYQTELFFGNDNLYVKLANTGNVVINSNDNIGNTAQWTFETNGTLSNPGPIQMAVYANTTVRDADITSPQPGMMIYVTGTGMQVRGATSWNTIAGSGT